MRGFSKAIIAGNLTRDPETRTTPSGASVTNFTVAVNRVFKSASGENKETVSFIDCDAWDKAGELIAQYCHKGSPLLVSGRLEQRSWEDKNTGQKRSAISVRVEDFTFISDRAGAAREDGDFGGAAELKKSDSASQEVVPDDVPEGEIDLSDVPF